MWNEEMIAGEGGEFVLLKTREIVINHGNKTE